MARITWRVARVTLSIRDTVLVTKAFFEEWCIFGAKSLKFTQEKVKLFGNPIVSILNLQNKLSSILDQTFC